MSNKVYIDEPIRTSAVTLLEGTPGRRLRAFARIVVSRGYEHKLTTTETCFEDGAHTILDDMTDTPTYGAMLEGIEHDSRFSLTKDRLSTLKLRTGDSQHPLLTAIPDWQSNSNASLHIALQDLANIIIDDAVEACTIFDDPNYYYPGVDTGIEPVSDEHVKLVIWGVRREWIRESVRFGHPAPDLAELPWSVQRAFAERRRLRFQQFGIGRKQYEEDSWSLFEIPMDPEWVPANIYTDG